MRITTALWPLMKWNSGSNTLRSDGSMTMWTGNGRLTISTQTLMSPGRNTRTLPTATSLVCIMRLLINHVSEVKSNRNAHKSNLVSSSIFWTDQLNSHFENIEIKSVCKDSVINICPQNNRFKSGKKTHLFWIARNPEWCDMFMSV